MPIDARGSRKSSAYSGEDLKVIYKSIISFNMTFMTFSIAESKCSENWSLKSLRSLHFVQIWPNIGSNLTGRSGGIAVVSDSWVRNTGPGHLDLYRAYLKTYNEQRRNFKKKLGGGKLYQNCAPIHNKEIKPNCPLFLPLFLRPDLLIRKNIIGVGGGQVSPCPP